MNKKPVITIVIATYNSDKVIGKCLNAIRRQNYPKQCIQIIVVDGGSTDRTKRIATEYGCKIYHNKYVFPARAKYIGLSHAIGEYVMFLDSDEVIVHPDSISRKIAAFKKSQGVRIVMGSGYVSPKVLPFVNQYINEFGDPFSFYYYRLSKANTFFLSTMQRRYQTTIINKDETVFVFSLIQSLPLIEVVAMGTVIDRNYIRTHLSKQQYSSNSLPHLFYSLIAKGAKVVILHNDPLMHYSAATMGGYLRKIKSRVVNNIFSRADEGFNGRNQLGANSKLKKYGFLLYAFTLIGPLIDALILMYTRRSFSYIFHIFLTVYTALLIVYYYSRKLIGLRPVVTSYGT